MCVSLHVCSLWWAVIAADPASQNQALGVSSFIIHFLSNYQTKVY